MKILALQNTYLVLVLPVEGLSWPLRSLAVIRSLVLVQTTY